MGVVLDQCISWTGCDAGMGRKRSSSLTTASSPFRRKCFQQTPDPPNLQQFDNSRELATVTGSSLVCDKTQVQKFVQNTRFGVEQDEDSTLKGAEENKVIPLANIDSALLIDQENSNFYMTPAWVVTLSCSAHRGQITKHTIFAVSANAAEAGPENNDLKGKEIKVNLIMQFLLTVHPDRPTLMQWIVEIDLTRNKKIGSRKKKLKILCKITGTGTIDVEVRSQLGQVIPSTIRGR